MALVSSKELLNAARVKDSRGLTGNMQHAITPFIGTTMMHAWWRLKRMLCLTGIFTFVEDHSNQGYLLEACRAR
jgi:hypothetical protein